MPILTLFKVYMQEAAMAELSYTERKSTHCDENTAERLWRYLAGLAGGVATWYSANLADRNLRRLDDRLLADIGLTRDEASGAVEELPERLSAEPVRPTRAAPDRGACPRRACRDPRRGPGQ